MPYTFPPIQAESVLDQVFKVREEAGEVMAAIPEGRDRVAEEAMDTIHACETLLRQLGVDYDIVAGKVAAKNKRRGYYL